MTVDADSPQGWRGLARSLPGSSRRTRRKRHREGGLAAPRVARAIIVAVLYGYVFNALMFVWGSGLPSTELSGFAGCLLAALFLQLSHSTQEALSWPVPLRVLTLSVQAIVTFLPFTWVGPQAGSIAGFLAGSMLLVVAGPWRWGLFFAVAAGVGVLLALREQHLMVVDVVYSVYFTLLTGLMVYGVSSLASLVRAVHAAQGEFARMAVARERLRVARDLHDLLGYNVSAMTLKSELAYRLLPGAAERARSELRDVLVVARRALAEVRVVAGGYLPMSLTAEAESAKAMLSVAEMRARVNVSQEGLPEALDTVLAIVLREAVTNVLRHSKAQHCEIEASVEKGRARLRVCNDGVEPELGARSFEDGTEPRARSFEAGTGLGNLKGRLEAAGGRLSVTVDDEWFRLTAEAPVAPVTARAAVSQAPGMSGTPQGESARPDARDDGPPGRGPARAWHLRVARFIAVLVLSGYGLLIVVNVLARPTSPLELAGFTACVAVLVGVQIVDSLGEPRSWPAWLRRATLVVQTVATLLPLLWIGAPWGSMGGFLAGAVLLMVASFWRWVLYAAIGAGVLLLSVLQGDTVEWTAYLVISTLLTGLVVFGIGSLSDLVARVDRARRELAWMAVTQERLRVARDLHDLLGNDLSVMIAKSELAYRLLPGSAERAKCEVAEVLEIARRAVADVRAVAGGYRHMSFGAESDLLVSTLAAAGIDVEVRIPEDVAPGNLDAVLAVVLREAATNVLRHSRARHCVVEMAVDEAGTRLCVTNDGVPPGTLPDVRDGSGLGDLTERLRAVGGRLTAEVVDGTFRLVVVFRAEKPRDMPGGVREDGSDALSGDMPRDVEGTDGDGG
ncbi:histidine kinase [Streptosporangium sp. NPDC049078]|uniref:sensor histidine kinase n=1 Tax=Streptosporangium sp. NPDC049078 TaxID=3155767 RepID=UPI00344753E1